MNLKSEITINKVQTNSKLENSMTKTEIVCFKIRFGVLGFYSDYNCPDLLSGY